MRSNSEKSNIAIALWVHQYYFRGLYISMFYHCRRVCFILSQISFNSIYYNSKFCCSYLFAQFFCNCFVDQFMASFLYCSLLSYHFSNYCDSNNCRLFMLLKAILSQISFNSIYYNSKPLCIIFVSVLQIGLWLLFCIASHLVIALQDYFD